MNEFVVLHNITDEKLLEFVNNICHSLQYRDIDSLSELHNAFLILHIKTPEELSKIDLEYLVQKNFIIIITENCMIETFYNLSYENRFFLVLNSNENTKLLEINIKGFLHYIYKIYELLHQNFELEEKIFDLAFATTDVLEQKEKMEDIAIRDGMTKLYNHSFFRDMLTKEFECSKENGEIFSIAILDLDFFKHVNDRYGHLKGDEVLKAFASTILEHVDSKLDIAARYGGEEFAIIFRKQTVQDALNKIESIRKSFDTKVFTYENSCFKVTFSAGITQYTENLTDTVEMIKFADEALYQSKKDGRNRNTVKIKE